MLCAKYLLRNWMFLFLLHTLLQPFMTQNVFYFYFHVSKPKTGSLPKLF